MITDERQVLIEQYTIALKEMSMCDSNNEGHTEALREAKNWVKLWVWAKLRFALTQRRIGNVQS